MSDDAPILTVSDLEVEFKHRRGIVQAVSGVSFDLARGETLGLVGESGCGKSTTARAIVQLPRPTAGTVTYNGHELTSMRGKKLLQARRRLPLILQDPISSLNPRRKIEDIVGQPLRLAGVPADERRERVRGLLARVGIDPNRGQALPHEFSGGQCQRISIARALATDPEIILCDEPVSALDVSVQAQIVNLLSDAREERGVSMIFVSHDLAVVRRIADRIAVMYLGQLCELSTADRLFETPAHHYSTALMSAIPRPDPTQRDRARVTISAEMPSPLDPPTGCRFRTRCPAADARCADEQPMLREIRTGQMVACHHPITD
jgi:peptide/nickel transport system ATP-binding protein